MIWNEEPTSFAAQGLPAGHHLSVSHSVRGDDFLWSVRVETEPDDPADDEDDADDVWYGELELYGRTASHESARQTAEAAYRRALTAVNALLLFRHPVAAVD